MRDFSDRATERVKAWPWTVVPTAVLLDRSISPSARIAYSVMSSWGGKNGRVMLSNESIAEAVGCSRGTIQRNLKELESAGLLVREKLGRCSVIVLSKPDLSSHREKETRTAADTYHQQYVSVEDSDTYHERPPTRTAGGTQKGTKKKENLKEKVLAPPETEPGTREEPTPFSFQLKTQEVREYVRKICDVYPLSDDDSGKRYGPAPKRVAKALNAQASEGYHPRDVFAAAMALASAADPLRKGNRLMACHNWIATGEWREPQTHAERLDRDPGYDERKRRDKEIARHERSRRASPSRSGGLSMTSPDSATVAVAGVPGGVAACWSCKKPATTRSLAGKDSCPRCALRDRA